ncbi:hypothetical protein [Actinomadura meridiana]
MRQAATVLDMVPAVYRTQLTTEVGRVLLDAVPGDQRQRAAVRDFRRVLIATAPRPVRAAGA